MAAELERRAKEAFVDDAFDLAVDFYSQAINLDPSNADLFADRAQANIKLKNLNEAVTDAIKAIELDPLLVKAYMRKGIACIELQDYQTAKAALEAGASIAKNDLRFAKLIKECQQHIAEENGDHAMMVCQESPSTSASAPVEAEKTNNTSHDKEAVAPLEPKYRREFYQKPEEVVVTIFAKGIKAGNLNVDFGEQILSVTIDVSDGSPYYFQPQLYAKIVPEKCRYELLPTKIEIRLAKAEPIRWTSLEFSKGTVAPQKAMVSSVKSDRPSYPSSKPRGTDWDKLEAQMKKEEKDEKLDGDAAVNKFFRDIYQDVDEDTRRAMCKSFVESNGTVLSTDWKDVGSRKVETSPPDSMEVRKWEY